MVNDGLMYAKKINASMDFLGFVVIKSSTTFCNSIQLCLSGIASED